MEKLKDLGYVESRGAVGERLGGTDHSVPRRFYGKYRGTVLNNVDPERRNRLLVQVVDVLGIFSSSWAMPCLPFGGVQTGFYLVPAIGAGVWVEFEQGNPDRPIWVGCYWGSTPEVPATAMPTTPGVPVLVLQTPGQSAVVVSDLPVPPMKAGGVLLRSGASYIAIDPSGITLVAPTITIMGATNVNNGALTVT